VFDGTLTAAVLLTRTSITAINGEVYTVEHQVIASGRRRSVLITIGNNKSRALLTILDVPSGAGVLHGTDTVLERGGTTAGGGGEIDSSQSDSNTDIGWVEWSLIFIACLLLLTLLVVLVISRARSRRPEPREPPANWNTVVNPMEHSLAEGIAAMRNDGPQRSPGLETMMRSSTVDTAVPLDRAALDAEFSDAQHVHYYPPPHSVAQYEPTVMGRPPRVVRRKWEKQRGKGLSTPAPPEVGVHWVMPDGRGSWRSDGGYLDPDAGSPSAVPDRRGRR